MKIIETERLILRELQPSDAAKMFELDSNPEVHKYLGNHPIHTINQAEEVIASVRNQYITNGIGRWATVEKSSGEFIGWSGLKFISKPENNQVNFYDVGYRLMPKYWGKGYATESAKAALGYAFNTMNLNEVVGTCHEDNIASRRALEKCGLIFVKKFLYKNELTCDWLKISKDNWRNRIKLMPFQHEFRDEVNQMVYNIKQEFDLPIPNASYKPMEPDWYLVAKINEKIVGTVALIYQDGFAVLKRMYVAKALRGKEMGVSQLLLNQALNACRQMNFDTIYLGTMEEFKAAQRFYEKNNFIKIAKEDLPNYFPNNPVDVVFYKLRLNYGN